MTSFGVHTPLLSSECVLHKQNQQSRWVGLRFLKRICLCQEEKTKYSVYNTSCISCFGIKHDPPLSPKLVPAGKCQMSVCLWLEFSV